MFLVDIESKQLDFLIALGKAERGWRGKGRGSQALPNCRPRHDKRSTFCTVLYFVKYKDEDVKEERVNDYLPFNTFIKIYGK